MKRILIQQAKTVSALYPQSIVVGNLSGLVVDRDGLREGILAVQVGAGSGTVTAKLQHGSQEDGSDMVDVPGKVTPTIGANGIANVNVDLEGLKRYVRVVFTVATGAMTVGAVLTLGNAEIQPVTL